MKPCRALRNVRSSACRTPISVKRVVAVVTAKAGAALEEKTIQAALANELAKFKQPKKVFVTTELPRNAMGKVQKKDLRAQHAKTFTT